MFGSKYYLLPIAVVFVLLIVAVAVAVLVKNDTVKIVSGIVAAVLAIGGAYLAWGWSQSSTVAKMMSGYYGPG